LYCPPATNDDCRLNAARLVRDGPTGSFPVGVSGQHRVAEAGNDAASLRRAGASRSPPNHHTGRTGLEDPMTAVMKKFWNDESGATAVEYGLMVALIAVVIITAVALIGTNLNTKFNTVAQKVGE
jgi:pilus assembly protein Flp/PilA